MTTITTGQAARGAEVRPAAEALHALTRREVARDDFELAAPHREEPRAAHDATPVAGATTRQLLDQALIIAHLDGDLHSAVSALTAKPQTRAARQPDAQQAGIVANPVARGNLPVQAPPVGGLVNQPQPGRQQQALPQQNVALPQGAAAVPAPGVAGNLLTQAIAPMMNTLQNIPIIGGLLASIVGGIMNALVGGIMNAVGGQLANLAGPAGQGAQALLKGQGQGAQGQAAQGQGGVANLLKNPNVAKILQNNPNLMTNPNVTKLLQTNPDLVNQLAQNPDLMNRLANDPALVNQLANNPDLVKQLAANPGLAAKAHGGQVERAALAAHGAAQHAEQATSVDDTSTWVDGALEGPARGSTPRHIAHLRAGDLSVQMHVGEDERGDTVMRATFDRDGQRDTTEDNWSSDERDPTSPSRFAERFQTLTATLDGGQRAALAHRVTAARDALASQHASVLHAIAHRELQDSAQDRLSLLTAGARA